MTTFSNIPMIRDIKSKNCSYNSFMANRLLQNEFEVIKQEKHVVLNNYAGNIVFIPCVYASCM